MSVLFIAGNTYALSLSWVTHGDVAIVGNDFKLATNYFGAAEWQHQTNAIYGISAKLPKGIPGVTVTFDRHLHTWDSYNGSWGYWDSFSITLTEGGYYWQKSLTDPINSDPDITAVGFLWGGLDYGTGTLEHNIAGLASVSFLTPDPTKDYYINFVLDTHTSPASNTAYPSWGTFTNVNVDVGVIPEPATLLLLGSGLFGLGGFSLLQRKKKS